MIYLPDSLREYCPKKWLRKYAIKWSLHFLCLGVIIGIVAGSLVFWKVNYQPLQTKYTELQTEFRKSYVPPKPVKPTKVK